MCSDAFALARSPLPARKAKVRATAGFASYGEKSCRKIRIWRGYLNMNYQGKQSVLQSLHRKRIIGHDLR
ncbi:hypothetical protein EHI48_32390 [Rhizobium sp. WSM1325]|nr:hypothetical protein EHI48_32390 [Rhizobium leguminosarum]